MTRLARKIIERPLNAAGLSRDEVAELLDEARGVFEGERALIEVAVSSVLFVGDTHGDLRSTLTAFRFEALAHVFLGDYVDRGPNQLENFIFLAAKKIEEPERVYLLRGNHESPLTNAHYGFFREVARRYGPEVYGSFSQVFSMIPYAALVNGTVLALHGGIASALKSLDGLRHLPRPDELPENPVAFEILWNDPSEDVRGFAPSPRGPGVHLFGRDAFEDFAAANGIEVMVRAHEYHPEGLREYFSGRVLSVFSCRYYPAAKPKGLRLSNGWREVVSLM